MRKSLAGAVLLLPCSLALASPPSASDRLIFADEFNGNTLDTARWGYGKPWNPGATDPSNVLVSDGALSILTTRTSSGFTDTGISTGYAHFTYTGGYAEARVLLPNTVGSWPAFWGLYTGWPPEADIMEYPLTTDGTSGLQSNQYNTAFHYTNSSGGNSSGAGVITRPSDLRGSYHTFGMDWVPNTSVSFYFDGTKVQSFTSSAVSQMVNMYLLLTYSAGGWPGTPSLTQWPVGWTDQMKVDYVRVWQTNPNNDAPTSWNIDGDGDFATSANWTIGEPTYGNESAVFGRIGTASTATINLPPWDTLGGITFQGGATGTTGYVIGSSVNAGNLQLASTTGSALVRADASSTASQSINASMELWSNTTVRNDMTNGSTLSLNGTLSGAGSLSIEGAGTVVVAGNNTYTGGTILNASGQGPAVLRATASGALGSGGVIVGPQGNGTTARLELYGRDVQLDNNIDFRGRNNSSVGIENINGDGSLGGTISINVGGSTYLIQSDAGSLTLSGAASSATVPGVALQSNATGDRLVTLSGAGTGAITGDIRDGAGQISIAKTGDGTWTLSGANTYTGATSSNAGKLVLGSSLTTSSAISASGTGIIQLASGGGRIIVTPSVTTSDSGRIDLTDNALIVTTAGSTGTWDPRNNAYTGITGEVASARHGGDWTGAGITSSLASTASSPGGSNLYTLGVAKAGDVLQIADSATSTFTGQTVHGSDTIVMYTYGGDANLDGKINIDDYGRIDGNVGQSGTVFGWYNGDFNYDGKINIDDYGIIDGNIGQQGGQGAPIDTSGIITGVVGVPEPASLGLLLIGGAALLPRARRRITSGEIARSD